MSLQGRAPCSSRQSIIVSTSTRLPHFLQWHPPYTHNFFPQSCPLHSPLQTLQFPAMFSGSTIFTEDSLVRDNGLFLFFGSPLGGSYRLPLLAMSLHFRGPFPSINIPVPHFSPHLPNFPMSLYPQFLYHSSELRQLLHVPCIPLETSAQNS